MGESISKLTIEAGVQGGAAAAGELQKVAASIDATGAAAQAAAAAAGEYAAKQSALSRELAIVAAEAAAVSERGLDEQLDREAAAAERAADSQERLSRILADANLQSAVAAERELEKQFESEAAAAAKLNAEQEKLSRLLADANLHSAVAAERELEAQFQAEADAAKEAAEANQQYSTKTQDLVGILNRISPRLGEMALALVRLGRLTGDVATANLSFGKAVETVSGFVKSNAAALALQAAGYAAFAAIQRGYNVWKKEQEDIRKATEEANRYKDAVNELQKSRAGKQQSIEDVAYARKEGGLTDEQARGARAKAARIKAHFGESLSEENINQGVGLFAGTDLSDDELVRVIIALQQGRKLGISKDQSPGVRTARARRGAAKFGSQIDIQAATESGQQESIRRAQAETLLNADGDNGPTKDQVKDALTGFLGETPENLDVLAETFRKRRQIRDAVAKSRRFRRSDLGGAGSQTPGSRAVELGGAAESVVVGSDGAPLGSPQELGAIARIMEIIEEAAQKYLRESGSRGGGDNYFTGPVQLQGSGPITNGQTRASEAGE